jgi:hypothetical protein
MSPTLEKEYNKQHVNAWLLTVERFKEFLE